MFITAENIRTGEVRTFLGNERILVPDSKQPGGTFMLSAHWETVEECLDLRKYSKFFYVSESEGGWKKGEEVKIPATGQFSSSSDREDQQFVGMDSYRVLGIFLEKG